MNQLPQPQPSSAATETPGEVGLSSLQATRRLDEFGFNEPVGKHRGAAVVQLLLLFTNPLVVILLAASTISFLVGNKINAVIIVLMVLLSVAVNFAQTWRSRRAAKRPRIQVLLMAAVLRDGKWREVLCQFIVPGDVVQVKAGGHDTGRCTIDRG